MTFELKPLSIGISLLGGFLGAIFGFGMIPSCEKLLGGESICLEAVIYGAISVFAIIGAIIEFKKLLIGSVVSTISGVLGLVFMAIIILIPFSYDPRAYLLLYLSVIAGGGTSYLGACTISGQW